MWLECNMTLAWYSVTFGVFKAVYGDVKVEGQSQTFISWLQTYTLYQMDRVKRIWYLLPMRAAKVQTSLRIHAVSPEPSLLAHTSSESRGTFRQKARSLAPLNGWACPVKICHDGMLEDTNSLDAAQMQSALDVSVTSIIIKKDFGVLR